MPAGEEVRQAGTLEVEVGCNEGGHSEVRRCVVVVVVVVGDMQVKGGGPGGRLWQAPQSGAVQRSAAQRRVQCAARCMT